MAQLLLPDADNATGSWTPTPLWSKVDDDSTVNPTGDDVEITSDQVNNSDTSVAELSLAPGSDPEVSTGHIIRVRWSTDHNAGQFNPARVTLRQGTISIATLEANISGQTEVETTYTLTGTEADSITSYSDLNVQIQGINGKRGLVVDLVELEIPDAPAGLNAPGDPAATADSTTQITVTWTDTNTAEDGYRVERSPAGENNWVDVSGNLAADTTQYVDSGLDPGTSYDYRIFAFDAGGDGPASSTVTARTDSEQIGNLPVAAVIGQWDARDLPGTDNDPVDSWADVGPDAQDALAQATAAKQPVLDDSDSLRWVLFDGSDDLLTNDLDQTYGGDFAIIAVLEPLTYPSGSAAVLYSTGFVNGVTEKNILGIDDVEAGWPDGAWVVMSGDGTQGDHHHGTDLTLNTEATSTRFVMTQLIRNAGLLRLWENNVLVIDVDPASAGDLNDLAGMFLGSREDESRHMNARVGFLLLVDMSQATETELLSARDDLMADYGIAAGFDETGRSVSVAATVAATDQVALSDSAQVDAAATIAGTDQAALNESVAVSASATVTATDSLGQTESVAVSAAATVQATDTLAATDSTQVSATATIDGSDSAALVDTPTVSVSASVEATDSFNAGGVAYDETGRAVSASATVEGTDSLAAADSLNVSATTTVGATDSAAYAESTTVDIAATVDASDTLDEGGVAHDETGRIVSISATVGSTDNLAAADSTTVSGATSVSGSDTLAATESLTVDIAGTVSATDSETPAESLAISANVTVTVADKLAASETATVSAAAAVTAGDGAALTESLLIEVTSTVTGTDVDADLPVKAVVVAGAFRPVAAVGAYRAISSSGRFGPQSTQGST